MPTPVLRPWRRDDADALRDLYASTSDLGNQIGDADLSSVAKAEDFIERALGSGDAVRNWAIVDEDVVV